MPLRILDDDALHVSVSQLKAWLRCPRQYELKYVRGVDAEFVPHALAFGIAYHAALAAHFRERQAGSSLPVDVLMSVFAGSWTEQRARGVPIEVTDGPDDVDLGKRMLTAFLEHDAGRQGEIVEVERRVSALLHDPDTGELLEERLTGFVDLIVREGGRHVVVEHKTSARRYTEDQLQYDHQPTAYLLALRQEGLGDVGARYEIVTKTKTPAVQVEDVHRDGRDEDDFLRVAVGVLRAIDAGVSFPIRGWQCRACPYARACGSR
jgi:CRISPR/Cas system-associated exonuclease Cas4 (RecB family)